MIYKITQEVLADSYSLHSIYSDTELNYYWSDDFSQDFYRALAKAGFISVSTNIEGKQLLLCEIQKAYSVLHFNSLHISKKIRALKKKTNFILRFNTAFNEVIESIAKSYENCWIFGKYSALMKELHNNPTKEFSLVSCELFDTQSGTLVAGELGYFTDNRVYTSLSGFHSKEKQYNNCGTLQLVLLAEYLETEGIRFWNLGHPYMQYKTDLGAKVYERAEFLQMWYEGVRNSIQAYGM